jgi:SOS-response transcriptional repressor LexA
MLIGLGDLIVINENTRKVNGKLAAVYMDQKILLRRTLHQEKHCQPYPVNKDYRSEASRSKN